MLRAYKCSGGGNATFLRDPRTLLACKGSSAYKLVTFMCSLFCMSFMSCEIFSETMYLGQIFPVCLPGCDIELVLIKCVYVCVIGETNGKHCKVEHCDAWRALMRKYVYDVHT